VKQAPEKKQQNTQSPSQAKRLKMDGNGLTEFDLKNSLSDDTLLQHGLLNSGTTSNWACQDFNLWPYDSYGNDSFLSHDNHFTDAFQHNHSLAGCLINDTTNSHVNLSNGPDIPHQPQNLEELRKIFDQDTTETDADGVVLCPDSDCCDKSDCESVGCPTPCADDACSIGECDDCEVTPCQDCTELTPCYGANCQENYAGSEISFAIGRANSSSGALGFTHQAHSKTGSLPQATKRKFAESFEPNYHIDTNSSQNQRLNGINQQNMPGFLSLGGHDSHNTFASHLGLDSSYQTNLGFSNQNCFETPHFTSSDNPLNHGVRMTGMPSPLDWQSKELSNSMSNNNGGMLFQPYTSHQPLHLSGMDYKSSTSGTSNAASNSTSISASPCTPMSMDLSRHQSLSDISYDQNQQLTSLDTNIDYGDLFKDGFVGSLYCPFFPCDNDFSQYADLDKHLTTVHPKDVVYHCHVSEGCSYATDNVSTFARHVLAEKARVIPEVEIIPPTTKVEEDIDDVEKVDLKIVTRAHVCNWTEHDTNDAETPICGHVFNDPAGLQEHVKTVHIGKLCKKSGFHCHWKGCYRRDQSFTQKGKVERHVQTHTNCKGPSPSPCYLFDLLTLQCVTSQTRIAYARFANSHFRQDNL